MNNDKPVDLSEVADELLMLLMKKLAEPNAPSGLISLYGISTVDICFEFIRRNYEKAGVDPFPFIHN